MQVILLEAIKNLGKVGEEVSVSKGFGSNYLIPQGKALHADDANRGVFAAKKKELEEQDIKKRTDAERLREIIEASDISLPSIAGDSGQLYGSVTSRTIANSIGKAIGQEINHRSILLNDPIKTIGSYEILCDLHPEVSFTIKVSITRK